MTDYLYDEKKCPGVAIQWGFMIVVLVLLILIAVKTKSFTSGMTGNDLTRSLDVGATASFNALQSHTGSSSFTGGYNSQAPNYTENAGDSGDDGVYGQGLSADDTPHYFTSPDWAAFEAAVYPKLTVQLRARYMTAPTADKVALLQAAGAQMGISAPKAAPTSGFRERFVQKAKSLGEDPLAHNVY